MKGVDRPLFLFNINLANLTTLKPKDAVAYWLESAGALPVLPHETMLYLSKQIQTLEEDDPKRKRAIAKMIRHNLKLIPQQVRRIIKQRKGAVQPGASQEDLLQAGVEGLHKAVLKYDYTRGYTFSTYACYWIYQQVQRASYANMSIIRVPENTLAELFRYENPLDPSAKDVPAKVRERYDDARLAMGVKSAEQQTFDPETNERREVFAGTYSDPPLRDSVEELFALTPKLEALDKDLIVSYVINGEDYGILSRRHNISRHMVAKKIKDALRRIRRAMKEIHSEC